MDKLKELLKNKNKDYIKKVLANTYHKSLEEVEKWKKSEKENIK